MDLFCASNSITAGLSGWEKGQCSHSETSLVQLQAELTRLKSNALYARCIGTEFDDAARDDVTRSFAKRFEKIEELVQQQELLKVQVSVQAGAAPARAVETAEQKRMRLESTFSTFKQ
eukprot:1195479-Prorocentrum_minimum.AAC.1